MKFRLHARLFSKVLPWLAVFLFFPIASPRAADAVADNPIVQMEPADPAINPTNGLGSWIWEENTRDSQSCQMWNTFEIPAGGQVVKARLVMTVDNEFTLYLDGRELGRGVEWRELYVFNLTPVLSPGRHVLAVKCYNGSFLAGMLFGLQVDLADGHSISVKSDESWRIVPEGVKRWEKQTEAQPDWRSAVVKAPLGGHPWWTAPDAVLMMPLLQPLKTYFWQSGWFQVSLLLVSGVVMLISFRLMAQLVLYRKERFLLQRERARIASDIHDDIGARMTHLVLMGELAQNELPADAEMRLQLTGICEEARGLLSTMDEILWAVNPQRDTLRDFAAYVCKYAQDFLASSNIQCLFEVGPEMSAAAFDLPLRRSLLMAIKESLNNAVKHSAATELRLQIHWHDERLVVVVHDNGKGFDLAAQKADRHGLGNMAQRMWELGGTFQITSRPKAGCRIELSIPLEHPRRNFWGRIWKAEHFTNQPAEAGRPPLTEPKQAHDPTKC